MSIVHVFHANGAAWIGMHVEEGHVELGTKWFRMGLYNRVADIACEDNEDPEEELNQAFEDTSHVGYEWWINNLNVIDQYWNRPGWYSPKPRSSSIGDIFVLNGKAYMALATTWAEIPLDVLKLTWPLQLVVTQKD